MSARFVLRLDDIAPNMNWDHYHRLKPVLADLAINPILGVIPDNQDPKLLALPPASFDFWEEMCRMATRGWKLAMHGYQHSYVTNSGGILNRNARSEFAGLPESEQLAKLVAGRKIMEEQGVPTDTFMAPAHSYDRATLSALVQAGFEAMTDGFAFYPYVEDGIVHVPQLFARPRSFPFGIHTTCIHLNTMNQASLDLLIGFLRSHRKSFVDFDVARTTTSRNPLNRWPAALLRRLVTRTKPSR